MKHEPKQQLTRLYESNEPLLTDDEIVQALRANTSDAEVPRTTSRRFFRPTTLALTLAACSIAVVAVINSLDDESVVVSPLNNIVEEPLSAPANRSVDYPKPEDNNATMADAKPLLPPQLTVSYHQPSQQELETLSLTVTAHKVRYSEDGATITVSTNGIAARNTSQSPTPRTPRHISLYHSGVLYASWYTTSTQETNVNSLVPVRIELSDPTNTMFPKATAILWYEPEVVSTSTPQEPPTSSLFTSLRVHPNPLRSATATLRVDCSAPCTTTALLVDLQGRVAATLWEGAQLAAGRTEHVLNNLHNLPNGMYLIVLSSNDQRARVIERILIER